MICPNPNCKRIVSPYDEKCQHCGTPLKSHPVKDYMKKADKTIEDAEARAEDIKEQIRSGFKDNGLKKDKGSDHRDSQHFIKEDRVSSVANQYANKSNLNSKYSQQTPNYILRTDDILIFIRQRKDVRVQEMKSLVFGSPYVTGQDDRKANAEITDFYYKKENIEDKTSFEVNAYATYNSNRQRYEIHLLDGYLNFLLAVESFFTVRNEDILLGLFFRLWKGKGQLFLNDTVQTIMEYVREYPVFVEIVENAFVPCFEVIAHELGHICSGHCTDKNVFEYCDVSKNDERIADTFASNVLQTLFHDGLREALFKAKIKCDFAWVIKDRVYKEIFGFDIKGRTHPLADERIRNSMRENADLAKRMGISEEWFDKTIEILMNKIKQRLQEPSPES